MKAGNIYCGNCGKLGHVYKQCLLPIISLGIILTKKNKQGINEYIMIQRKDTIGFVEFMRGKYQIEDLNYLRNLFKIMTKKERLKIISSDFEELWNLLWLKKNNKQNFNEFENSKKKFAILKKGVNNNSTTYNLETINNTTPYIYDTPEWGFPKGRRNLHENDIDCAKREFEEETGISEDKYEILDINRINETFKGTNNISYRHTYYLAKLNDDTEELDITVKKENINQYSEISNIKWFNYLDGINIIRPYNIEKKNILKKANELINK